MFLDILTNLLSDFVFLIFAIVLGWAYLYCTRRYRLLRFFGIEKDRRILIYLSNLRVKQFGAIGVDEKPRSYSGSAGAFMEINAANRFRDLLNYFLPSISDNPGLLSKILISDVQVQILPSPLEIGKIDNHTTIITMGTPAYNVVSNYVETELNSLARFELGVKTNDSKISTDYSVPLIKPVDHSTYSKSEVFDVASPMPSGTASAYEQFTSDTAASSSSYFPPKHAPEKYTQEKESAILVHGVPPITESNYGFVERIFDRSNNRKILYIAGLSEIATAKAAEFLANNWVYLFKKYKCEENFLIMLHFKLPDYKNTSIIFER